MVPLFVHPSLILSEPFRPAGQPDLDSFLTPGEAVRATVLNAQDDGAVLLLVKGVMLRATSLIGRLPVGQVVDAHIEAREGQVLLRLDQPLQTETAKPIGVLAADQGQSVRQGGPGETQRMAALLKTLLPADAPLASGLAQLSASLTAAADRGELAQPTLVRFQALAREILLAPEQPGVPLTGDHIRRVLLTLGIQHEPALLAEWNRTGTITGRAGAPNLKVLLMALLAEATAGGRAEQVSSIPAEPYTTSAWPSTFSTVPASLLYDGTLGRSRTAGPSPDSAALQGRAWPEPTPLDQPMSVRPAGTMVPSAQSQADVPSQTEKPVFAGGPSPIQISAARQGEASAVMGPRQVLRGQPEGVEGQAASPAGPGPGPQSSIPSAKELVRGDHRPLLEKAGFVSSAAGLSSPAAVGAAAQEDESAKPSGASSLSDTSGWHEPEGLGRGGWIRDAQRVLTMIERTQTLAALNGQTGQPILIELPLACGGQVWLAVEERPAGGEQRQDQPRSYSVVTLLTLDGLGSVRVDTLLTGRRLSARFLLDRQEVWQRVTGYLPALNTSLSAKGYDIELLTTDLGEPQVVRGDDVRARAVPRVGLVNRKV